MKSRNKKKKKGSTLLEIVIALAIIGIMMLPLANSLLTSVKANKMGEETQEAKLLGQQIVEGLKGQDAIKPGNVNISGYEFNIAESVMGDKSKLDIKSANDINGYQVDGSIKGQSIFENNNSIYLDYVEEKNKLGSFIYIDEDEIKYLSAPIEKITLMEFLELVEANDFQENPNVNGLEKGIIKPTGEKKIKCIIKDDEIIISYPERTGDKVIYKEIIFKKTDGVIGVFLKKNTNIEFEFKNTSKNPNPKMYFFRDINMLKEEYDNCLLKMEFSGKIERVNNIIYDSKNAVRGLYDIKINIRKNNKVIEKINAQIYLRN